MSLAHLKYQNVNTYKLEENEKDPILIVCNSSHGFSE
jgi:hypothetical protein